jgi:ribonuclease P protein component
MVSPERFPRAARLLHPKDFRRVMSQGQRLSTALFRLQVLIEGDTPRLGLTVSRRVDTRAVVRNAIKRAARETFRCARASLPAASYVLMPRSEAAAATPAQRRAELITLWKRAATLKPRGAAGTMRDAIDSRAPARDP